MLWILRATLPDRPGALACLAQECGKAGANIVGLQVFPEDDQVVDELVLSVPSDWTAPDLRELVERAGGEQVVALRAPAEVVADQPTRYVEAARAVLAAPASFPDVVAHLFDADSQPGPAHRDVMSLEVGEVTVQLGRTTPFTATEHARGAAMAALVSDVLGRERPAFAPSGARRMGGGATPEHVVEGSTVLVLLDGEVVGRGRTTPSAEDPSVHDVDLVVDPASRRRGLGTRLLADTARLSRRLGAEEIVLTTRSDNQAVMPMLLAAGMRGRIRMAGEQLTVRILVRDLRPLS